MAAWPLNNLSAAASPSLHQLIAHAALPALTGLLFDTDTYNPAGRAKAAGVLMHLAVRPSLSETSSNTALHALTCPLWDTITPAGRNNAAGAIANLAASPGLRDTIANALPALCNILAYEANPAGRTNAAWALRYLSLTPHLRSTMAYAAHFPLTILPEAEDIPAGRT